MTPSLAVQTKPSLVTNVTLLQNSNLVAELSSVAMLVRFNKYKLTNSMEQSHPREANSHSTSQVKVHFRVHKNPPHEA